MDDELEALLALCSDAEVYELGQLCEQMIAEGWDDQ